jgi:zinc and cadmium transporter
MQAKILTEGGMSEASLSAGALLVIYCVLVLLASLAGGWLLLAMRLTHGRLQTAVSFVAGLMLGVALLHFIPHAAHESHSLDRTVHWVLGGFLSMFFLQRFFPHHHHDVSEGAPELHGHDLAQPPVHQASKVPAADLHTLAEHSASQLSWAATTVGMAFHSLLGGVALGAAVATGAGSGGGWVGAGTALVIVLHKPFDAMAVSTLMAASGCSRFARHLLNGLFALVTPVGALLFYGGASELCGSNPDFLACALAFCAGTFLCIACADLLPELQFHSHDRFKLSLALAAGLGTAILIGRLEALGHEHHEPGACQSVHGGLVQSEQGGTQPACFDRALN